MSQAKLFRSIVDEHGPKHSDASRLQQGPVKSFLYTRFGDKIGAMSPPRDFGLEGQGKAPRKRPARFSQSNMGARFEQSDAAPVIGSAKLRPMD